MKVVRDQVLVPNFTELWEAPKRRIRPPTAQFVSFAVQAIDGILRRAYNVYEFTDDADCLLRISRRTNDCPVELGGGTRIAVGDTLLELHLWNEHVPPFPADGPTIAWAAMAERLVARSLRLLARQLMCRPELADVRGLHAVTPFASRRTRKKMVRLAQRFGFEAVHTSPRSWGRRAHQAASNVLVAGFVWAYNPRSFHSSKIVREYVDLWMSRETLIERYGGPVRHQ